MRHGQEVETPVEHTVNVVSLKVQFVDVVFNLLVGGGVAKAQISVLRPQIFQVCQDFGAMLGTQDSNGNPARPSPPKRLSECLELFHRVFTYIRGNASWQGVFRIATMLSFLGAVHGQDLA